LSLAELLSRSYLRIDDRRRLLTSHAISRRFVQTQDRTNAIDPTLSMANQPSLTISGG
jgi:hypothetical protein